MERPCAWEALSPEQEPELERVAQGYIDFMSNNKTERECCARAIELARERGYKKLSDCIEQKLTLKPGDCVYEHHRNKTLLLLRVGKRPLSEGLNILGAHIDSPRLDVKQNPLDERSSLAYLDTHYYGGVKSYQWLTLPLALHGTVSLKDGRNISLVIGEDPSDPVFCISDLLPHLGAAQVARKASEFIPGESLDVLVGNRPLSAKQNAQDGEKTDTERAKDPVKARVLDWLKKTYGMEEEDFLSAEIEVVPAGRARELGFDRSMVLAYGQDDKACSYTSLIAQLDAPVPERSSVTLLVDKEEIGSVGATGMHSHFFENCMAEVCALVGESGSLALRRCLQNSRMLSSDVGAAYDPNYADVFEAKNSCYMGRGVCFMKYTGSRGKAGSNDANAEFLARVRRVMDEAKVNFQTAELGKVDAGGGGTIAYILATYGMEVVDCGIPVLSMHSPWEVSSKVDLYAAYKAYLAFLADA